VTKNRKSILSDVCFMNIPSFRRNSLWKCLKAFYVTSLDNDSIVIKLRSQG
jgi:hypothetical protein